MKRTFAILGVLLAAVVGAVFFILPAQVERRMNRTLAAPTPPPSGHALSLHHQIVVADLHADSLMWDRDLLDRGTRGHVDVPRLIEGNVALQAFTIVTKTPRGMNIEANAGDTDNIILLALAERWPPRTWTSLAERALYQARRLQETAARSGGQFTVIRSAHDLSAYLVRRTGAPRITAGFLGVEGAHALDGRLDAVDRLYDAGVRMMSPTHFFDNDMAGSAHGVKKHGLTDLGREMIRRMEAKGMIVDLAHASARTISDVLDLATRPVVVSHTGVKGTCDNARNLSDGQLKAIAGRGGLIGIGYWDTAVCGQDAGAIARAIRYSTDLVGVDHVALGSDYDGAVTAPFDTAGLVQITDALLHAGFSDAEVAQVMGGNTVRFLLNALDKGR